jgi:hypothetical protein
LFEKLDDVLPLLVVDDHKNIDEDIVPGVPDQLLRPL